MKTVFHAKSSSGGTYNVTFELNDGRFSVFCDCQAGFCRLTCRHKLALIGGDAAMLADEAEEDELIALRAKDEFRTLDEALERYQREISQIKAKLATVKEEERKIKKNFAGMLSGQGSGEFKMTVGSGSEERVL